jgi:hypothetical protein
VAAKLSSLGAFAAAAFSAAGFSPERAVDGAPHRRRRTREATIPRGAMKEQRKLLCCNVMVESPLLLPQESGACSRRHEGYPIGAALASIFKETFSKADRSGDGLHAPIIGRAEEEVPCAVARGSLSRSA